MNNLVAGQPDFFKKDSFKHYRTADDKKAWIQFVFTFSSTLIILLYGVYSLDIYSSVIGFLSLVFVIPVLALFIVRCFVLLHDCSHNSLFNSKKNNIFVGRILSLITLTPFTCWRRFHNYHHAHSGNLDKRGFGDLKTLTVTEYLDLSGYEKFLYRVYRNPIILFVIGPSYLFFIRQRFAFYVPKNWTNERLSVYLLNLSLLFVLVFLYFNGLLLSFLTIYMPSMAIASTIGVWLFYVQHQYPTSYWSTDSEWSFLHSVMDGASFYDLPPLLHWLTLNIGYHHVHHLDCKIPNYHLKSCYQNHRELQNPVRISLLESFALTKVKLWDCAVKKMINFSDIKSNV